MKHNQTRLERERQVIKTKPKNFKNFLKLLIAHASPLEIYEYAEKWQEELQQLKQELTRKNVVYEDEESKIYDKAQTNLIHQILGGTT
ncbi:MAG: hypothetical protein Q6356_003225 [Candidatus Wukongarchaeota archaeon]|nr:hypothetical protein [Candidatus Wukongarchaeota archaeon]